MVRIVSRMAYLHEFNARALALESAYVPCFAYNTEVEGIFVGIFTQTSPRLLRYRLRSFLRQLLPYKGAGRVKR